MQGHWPQLVKQLRTQMQLNQTQLAEWLRIDQATVSRWERGEMVPDFRHQQRLRDKLHRVEPIISRAAIEAMPGLQSVYRADALSFCLASSETLCGTIGLRCADLRNVDVRKYYSDSIDAGARALVDSAAWKSREAAWAELTICTQNRKWLLVHHSHLGETDLSWGSGIVLETPPDLREDEFKLKIVTKDDVII